MLPIALSVISRLYIKYIGQAGQVDRVKWKIIDFTSISYNTMFLLSHLTNQGRSTTLQYFASI